MNNRGYGWGLWGFRSLTSYKIQQQQQLQGYSLQKATYTHFHVYVLCTLVPFTSSVYRRQHDAAYFFTIVDSPKLNRKIIAEK